ncbi:NTP transferase domain-containing protein [Candidatus Pelagibacter bacterium nBUS_25]|uniref:NTP transferase domain-containing protein n=1 Tax=Candidatus Pelagibacter bacterium nBUS_25 TaxID=3374187 RepID=UPI003EBBDB18
MIKSEDKNKSFGSYIRKLRLQLGIGQRELAKKIGIAASFLNDIEKEKRSAPKSNIIKKISLLLKSDIDYLNDLAGFSKKTVAPDISDYIESNPKIVSLIRSIKKNELSNDQINEIEMTINKNSSKALIIAAGLGSRLKKHTENLPKCMLDFGGRTLLQRQLEVYKKCGVNDISVIRGYKKNKINYKGLKYFENTDYQNNNILNSIFYAEEVINGNIIISYSDILFEPIVVKRTLESNHDISVVVDIDWRGYYVGRKDHPISEAENVIFNSNNEVEKIGKINTGKEEVHGEFIGMIKLTNRGANIFKQHFHRLKTIYWNKPFQRAKTFQKAYLTDFIQELVDIGIKVHCVIIESGWKEIDTVEDYKKALVGFNKKFNKK